MKTCRAILLLSAAAAVAPAYGQSGPNLVISYNFADGNLHALSCGTVITFPAVDKNATATAVITIGNYGASAGVFTGITLTGSAFQFAGLPLLPAAVPAGQSVRFGVSFTPPEAGSFTGKFGVELGGVTISGSLAGATAPPSLSMAYVDPRTNNVIALPNGATLQIPDTPAGSTSTVTLLVPNTGMGTGEVSAVVLGDNPAAVFELTNLLPLPISVPPSQQLRFGVRFNAPEPQAFGTTLTLNLNGQTVTINLAARAVGPQFTYTFGPAALPLSPGGTLTMPDTRLGETSSMLVTVLNGGTGNGQLGGISLSGQGFTVTELPLFPATIRPNQTQQFTVNFAPAQSGALYGRLVIGSEIFTVTGKGIGPRMTYASRNATGVTTVAEGGVIFLAPTSVGGTQMLEFTVQNAGTGAATLSSINVSGAAFTLQGVPALPLQLDPGNNVAFSIGFSPGTTGSLTGSLQVNTSTFTLSGTGTKPLALPGYDFTGLTGSAQPAEQSTVGLSLSSSYPVTVQGTLVMTFVSDVFTDDPAIQFASGGRTVKFTIPANSTKALFNGVSERIPLQTGTTAGSIVITPSFTLQGGFDLTPPSSAPFSIAIQRAAPRLLTGGVSIQGLNAFTVTLSGYSTTRSLRQLEIQVSPQPGETFGATHLTLDVASVSASWFQATASQGFGGSFQIAIPLILQNGSASDDLVHRLQSLSITAINEVGTSAPLVLTIP